MSASFHIIIDPGHLHRQFRHAHSPRRKAFGKSTVMLQSVALSAHNSR